MPNLFVIIFSGIADTPSDKNMAWGEIVMFPVIFVICKNFLITVDIQLLNVT
jgi:hypothetical protein